LKWPEAVFNIVAEDPQEQHVAEQMQPAAMHEHGGEDGRYIGVRMLGESGGNERPLGDELISAGELDEKEQHIEADQGERDHRDGPPLRVVVADREHVFCGLPGGPCGGDHSRGSREVYRPSLPGKDATGGLSATVAGRMAPNGQLSVVAVRLSD
jgi:hypothetical protein